MPTLEQALEDYMTTGAKRRPGTVVLYRSHMRRCFGDWLSRPLDAITRRDVEARFHLVTERNGGAVANQAASMLRSVYRRPCVDGEGLRNPVGLWLAAGGRYNRPKRRRISAPAEVLPRSLTKRLVNHARPSDVTEGYAADWTVEQLREPAQRIADRIDALTNAQASPGQAAAQIGPQPVRRSVSSRTVSRRRRPPRRCGHLGRRARAACPRPRKDSVRDRKSPPFAKERQWRAHVIILTLLALTSRSSEMYRREQFAVAAHCNRHGRLDRRCREPVPGRELLRTGRILREGRSGPPRGERLGGPGRGRTWPRRPGRSRHLPGGARRRGFRRLRAPARPQDQGRRDTPSSRP